MQVEAGHQFHAVVFDGLWTHLQDLGDLLGVLAFRDESKNLALPICQLIRRIAAADDAIRGNAFQRSVGDSLMLMTGGIAHTLQSRLGLLGARLGLFGPCLRLFRACLCYFRSGLGLLRPRLSGFRPASGLLGSGLRLFRPGFSLLNARLLIGHACLLNRVFHFA